MVKIIFLFELHKRQFVTQVQKRFAERSRNCIAQGTVSGPCIFRLSLYFRPKGKRQALPRLSVGKPPEACSATCWVRAPRTGLSVQGRTGG